MSDSRPPGFRFWWTDAVILGAGALAMALLWGRLGEALWPIPFALGHFFLFCNVFRVRRSYELAWACILIINAGAWMLSGSADWRPILLVQSPVTVAVLLLEIHSPRYHGIFFRQLGRTPASQEGDA